MNLHNCAYCNKLFVKTRNLPLCNECDEMVFKQIKEHLLKNKGANSFEINQKTNIPINIIEAYLKDERLEPFRENQNICVGCGVSIDKDQRYCESCLKKLKLINELSNAYKEEKKPEYKNTGKFHININNRRR
jgi:predicted amidophosphoribosyltransferase